MAQRTQHQFLVHDEVRRVPNRYGKPLASPGRSILRNIRRRIRDPLPSTLNALPDPVPRVPNQGGNTLGFVPRPDRYILGRIPSPGRNTLGRLPGPSPEPDRKQFSRQTGVKAHGPPPLPAQTVKPHALQGEAGNRQGQRQQLQHAEEPPPQPDNVIAITPTAKNEAALQNRCGVNWPPLPLQAVRSALRMSGRKLRSDCSDIVNSPNWFDRSGVFVKVPSKCDARRPSTPRRKRPAPSQRGTRRSTSPWRRSAGDSGFRRTPIYRHRATRRHQWVEDAGVLR